MDFGPHALRDAICSVLRVRPNEYNWSAYPNVWEEASGLVYTGPRFKFYDFLEKVRQGISGERSGQVSFKAHERGQKFDEVVNEFFADEGIGWQLIEGEIVTRGIGRRSRPTVHGAVEALVD